VQKWLDIIRGACSATQVDNLKLGARKPPFPYSDIRLLPYLNHSFWFLPAVAPCHAMPNPLAEKQNVLFHDYKVLTVAGAEPGSASPACHHCGRRSVTGTTARRSLCPTASGPQE
jgi:hypothetical protein